MNTYERSFTYNKEVFILRILVCVKQVPDTAEIKIDPVTNTLIRAGVPSIVNPFDACALEVAARIKDADPSTEITLLSMGPDQAKDALRECLAVGGDKAYLCSDRKFGGSDTLSKRKKANLTSSLLVNRLSMVIQVRLVLKLQHIWVLHRLHMQQKFL